MTSGNHSGIKTQEEGVFAAPKEFVPTPNERSDDFFGNHQPSNASNLRDVDASYWNNVYRLSRHMGDAPDPLGEEEHDPAMTGDEPVTIAEDAPVGGKGKSDFKLVDTTKSDNKTVAKVTDELGGKPNPVQYPSRGKDAMERKVTPDFAGGQELIELHKMKEQLQKLEDKIAADPMVENKGTKKVLGQIDDLWKKLDELSDTLSPDFVKDYLS